jgi:hypothetical protein
VGIVDVTDNRCSGRDVAASKIQREARFKDIDLKLDRLRMPTSSHLPLACDLSISALVGADRHCYSDSAKNVLKKVNHPYHRIATTAQHNSARKIDENVEDRTEIGGL